LLFYQQEKLAPKVHRKNGGTATEETNKVVFECLDGFFGHVALIVIRGNKFICHIGVADGLLVCH
jgi:hypothetical protein